MYAVVARNTFPSQKCPKLWGSDHFWTVRCRFAGAPGRRPAWTCFEVMRCPYRFSVHRPFSQAWIQRFFVTKAMSADLSIGLCCVISFVVCKCCGLSLAVPFVKSDTVQAVESMHKRAVPMQYTLVHASIRWKIRFTVCNFVQPFKVIQSTIIKGKSARSCFAAESYRKLNAWMYWDNTWMLGEVLQWNCPSVNVQCLAV